MSTGKKKGIRDGELEKLSFSVRRGGVVVIVMPGMDEVFNAPLLRIYFFARAVTVQNLFGFMPKKRRGSGELDPLIKPR